MARNVYRRDVYKNYINIKNGVKKSKKRNFL